MHSGLKLREILQIYMLPPKLGRRRLSYPNKRLLRNSVIFTLLGGDGIGLWVGAGTVRLTPELGNNDKMSSNN